MAAASASNRCLVCSSTAEAAGSPLCAKSPWTASGRNSSKSTLATVNAAVTMRWRIRRTHAASGTCRIGLSSTHSERLR